MSQTDLNSFLWLDVQLHSLFLFELLNLCIESLLKSIEIIKEEQRIRKATATATANATASSLASAENIQRNNEIEAIKQRIQPYNELTDRKSAIIRSSMKETPGIVYSYFAPRF